MGLMEAVIIKGKEERLARIEELMLITNTTRKGFEQLGFSEAQVGSWFAKPGSARSRSPSAMQLVKIWTAYRWSPTYIVFGIGAKLLSQVDLHEDMYERMDRFEGVLQLALDEAAANKKRYRGALQTIEDRNEQIVNNKKTLAEFGKTIEVVNKNMAALSEQLAKLNRLD